MSDAKQIVRAYLDEVWVNNDPEAARRYLHPDFKAHAPGEILGLDAYIKAITRDRLQTDFSLTIHEMIGEGNVVAYRWTEDGRHTAPWRGIAPTGKPTRITGITMNVLQDDLIIAGYFRANLVGLLEQLGELPPKVSKRASGAQNLRSSVAITDFGWGD